MNPVKVNDKSDKQNSLNLKLVKIAGGFVGGKRDGHCSTVIDDKIFVFAGMTLDEKNASLIETNKLYCYDCLHKEWNIVKPYGDVPSARSNSCISSIGKKLYIFGGFNNSFGWLNDIYEFDSERKLWTKLVCGGEIPSPRDKAACASIGNELFIFGGFGPKENLEDKDDPESIEFTWFSDLFVFNSVTKVIHRPLQLNSTSVTPRAAHTLNAYENYLLLFGGRDKLGRQNDLHIYNTEENKWEMFTVNGLFPGPRSFHTATIVEEKLLILFGRGKDDEDLSDCHIFDIASKTWKQCSVSIEDTHGRCLHNACYVKGKFYLIAGSCDFNPETHQSNCFYGDFFNADI